MKKSHNIQFKSLILLLIYLISISPSILFHHHKSGLVSNQKAAFSEKASNFYYEDGAYTHKTNITITTENCWLCDNHNVSNHALPTNSNQYFGKELIGTHLETSTKYYLQVPFTLSNRGPPSVSSLYV